jgi:hypothetical protein
LYFRKPNIKLTTIKWQFYQILDNGFNDCSNRICILFIIGDLFSSGGFSTTSKDVGSINKDISFEDFRIKVSNVEKKY